MIEKTDKRSSERPAPGKRKQPKKATPARLERGALHYLERYATSTENLRRVLMRRVQRSAMIHGTDPEEGRGHVDAVIAKLSENGLLNDRMYAETRAVTMHRQGKGKRAIRQYLSMKGVEEADACAALDNLAFEVGTEEVDLASAVRYARRRRLGPWRMKDREVAREKDLAALGRRGFSYDIARKVIEAEDAETLEEMLAEAGADFG